MSSTELPPGWIEKESSSHPGQVYYFNTLTGQSEWLKPEFHAELHVGADDEVRASHILVKHTESRRPVDRAKNAITRTPEEAAAIIAEYRTQLVENAATFSDIASEHSDCSSARRAGDLGYFGRGKMQPPFEEAAFALDVGELSEAVSTPSGIHLILRTA